MPQFLASVITILVILHVILVGVAYLILLERKIASWVQDRIGPNRAGPLGLFQPLADGLKFILKEDWTPPFADRALFLLAPILVIVPAIIGWAVIPWGGYLAWGDHVLNITAAPVNIGVIYILAISSLAVYGVVLGGYASNSKYAFLGSLRATAQMLSYEIPMGLCALVIILMYGTARADYLVNEQATAGVWNIFYQPLLAIIFFVCMLAETNRAPFDLAEAEQELVGGYHTEYSSMKFALFFLGEYMHMITGCAFFALLFLGGWDPLFVNLPLVGGLGIVAVKAAVFFFKVFLLISLMMLIRWTLPRFRFDQLMRLAWRSLIPLSLVVLVASAAIQYFAVMGRLAEPRWAMLGANVAVAVLGIIVAPWVPTGPPVNRKVPLEGSRFNPPIAAR